MRQMDENFDGRISYKELRDHIRGLGFNMGLEDSSKVATIANNMRKKVETFVWRDKGIELVIRTLHSHLNKRPFEEFFKKFDSDHDNHLTPSEFRQALLSVKDAQLKKF
jgi:Ca2+-binding EF-hand superfamily protein